MKNGSKITAISGRAVPLRGTDIDTDRIIPARYLRCVTFDNLGPHAFEDDRQQNPAHPFNQPQYQGAAILLAGKNFGCGSSREHAPQSLSKWGIQALVGESFAEIFFGNCQAMGIPCLTASAADVEALFSAVEKDPTLNLQVDLTTLKVTAGKLSVQGCMPEGVRQSLVAGTWNATMILLEAGDAIEAVAARLPKLGAA